MRRRLALAVGLLAFAACKPPQSADSSTKSLDNMARGKDDALNVNDCVPADGVDRARFDQWVKQGLIKGPAASVEDLRQSLGGIEPVLALFFSAKYRIEIRSDAASVCAAAATAEQGVGAFDATEKDAKTSIPGCWRRQFYSQTGGATIPVTHAQAMTIAGNRGDLTEEFVVVLNASQRDVRHAALRTMAFALFQRLSRLGSDQGALVLGQKSDRFVALEHKLAELMLKDQAGKKDAMASTRHLLPSDVSFWTASQIADKWKAYRASEPTKAGAFEEIAAVEAFDSYYHCAKTKADMKKDYASLFQVVDQELAPELAGLDPAKPAAPTGGLGLTGENPSFGLCGGGLFPNLGCGQVGEAREERYGAVFPRMSWAWGNPSGCGLFIRWNC